MAQRAKKYRVCKTIKLVDHPAYSQNLVLMDFPVYVAAFHCTVSTLDTVWYSGISYKLIEMVKWRHKNCTAYTWE